MKAFVLFFTFGFWFCSLPLSLQKVKSKDKGEGKTKKQTLLKKRSSFNLKSKEERFLKAFFGASKAEGKKNKKGGGKIVTCGFQSHAP